MSCGRIEIRDRARIRFQAKPVSPSMDGDTGFAWNRILALSLISILPQLIVFFCAQDQFVEGISAGAVKG